MPKLNALSLKTLLAIDALTCAAMGAALLVAAAPASAITQIPQTLLQGAGLILLPIAAFMALTSAFALSSRWAVGIVILGNALWTAASILLPVSGFIAPNALGWAFLIGQAAVVAVLPSSNWMPRETRWPSRACEPPPVSPKTDQAPLPASGAFFCAAADFNLAGRPPGDRCNYCLMSARPNETIRSGPSVKAVLDYADNKHEKRETSMIRHLRTGLMTASIFALSSGAAFADYELNILHINDLHSRIESINKFDSTCSAEEEGKNECFGGVARLKTAIDGKRQELTGKNVLLLNAGDNFQGSLFFTTYKGAAEAEFLNLMKFDAMTIGNHEFDEGEGGLVPFLDKVTFPVISSNVLAGYKSKLIDRIKPSLVLDVGGQKIGIVGAVANDTPEISSPGDDVLIGVDVDTITTAVQDLKKQGVDKIIALTHVGYPRDLAVIAKIPDVDIVVGGHSHSLLSNTDEKAEGPYPTMVDNPGGYKVPVVQAGSYSKYLGDLVVNFDDTGVVKSAKGDPILIDSKFKPDEAVVARVKEMGKPIDDLKAKIIGKTEAAIDGTRESCRAKECEMGDLVADAMLDRVKGQGVTIAITNGGGLRASIDAGDVSMSEAITVLPFQNTVATFQIKGADIAAALENGLSQIEEAGGRFPQVAGMKFSFDRSRPIGNRISVVEVKEGEAYVPLDAGKTYNVVTNNFMRNGGDGYSIFKTKAENAYDYGPGLETVLADYLTANNPYKPMTDGRITEIAAATPAEPSTQTNTDTAVTTDAKPAATETATPEAKPAATAESKHVIAKGDTLWDLAKAVYGNGELWRTIAKANGNPAPRHLEIGKELTIPAK